MDKVLVVGGGIGGLTAAIGLRRAGIEVDLVELNPEWTVYGTGIIQQANVVRAMAQLGIVDEFLAAGLPYDHTRSYDLQGKLIADINVPRLAGPEYPSMLGIERPALQKVLVNAAQRLGTRIRVGVSVASFHELADAVEVTLTDGTRARYQLMVGADGLYSQVRTLLFGQQYTPSYTGQAVWRYTLPRPPEFDCLATQIGEKFNAGICPTSQQEMYLFLTSAEPGNPRMPEDRLAGLMRERLAAFGGFIGRLRGQITDSSRVVYRPLETVLVPAPWYRGCVVLIGDAAHGATPHLGQGAGMAIEDAVVLAEEVGRQQPLPAALERFMTRRWERAKFVWETSVGICKAELAGRKDIDRPALLRQMLELTAQPL